MFLNSEDLIIFYPDKLSGTLVMDCADYTDGMDAVLSDHLRGHSNDVCPLPCICHADEKPNCSPGVSIIRDGCDCCWICARQSGEGCSLRFKCDSVDNLDCYYETVLDVTTAAVVRESLTSGVRKKLTLIPPEADAVGTCWKVSGRPCYVNGTWLAHSGVQKTGCRHQCVCVDGTLVCTDLCAEVEQNRPSESVCSQVVDDRSATFQLQLMPPAEGECCRRWVCIAGINEDPLSNEGLRVVDTTVDHSFSSRTYDACKQVRPVTVNWSLCSQQCGLGLSTRWTTDTVDCRNITQVRLCFWRPCQTIKLASIQTTYCPEILQMVGRLNQPTQSLSKRIR
ncbi:hypothetical protein EG68_05495 [Paragonimus skrjabini miyazakii]|uniref:IGFBP N-terminal domain-containing protein n=1 Tax=Paragonimus skrjabini miyazakii TaxID=59628 RepID=A0A8S9Z3D3_9TREM|nr:hypothetical protein EG68_05495 [Paragonimus skrjabini miyazakii]